MIDWNNFIKSFPQIPEPELSHSQIKSYLKNMCFDQSWYLSLSFLVFYTLHSKPKVLRTLRLFLRFPGLSWDFFVCPAIPENLKISWDFFTEAFQFFNPFVPNAPILYPLKISENRKAFWCFQGVQKGCIGSKWILSYNFDILFTW